MTSVSLAPDSLAWRQPTPFVSRQAAPRSARIPQLSEPRHQGLRAILVEAAGYVGGRVLTHRYFADFPVELGAEFVHGPTNILMETVR